ncbi:hypothetical protein CRE_11921 [Caenorhabditis remanei]|uniref:Uncharacterized protein n=2 Tax=Caenorhabditis TaxID=6237 RepID=E3M4H4_CAERE|nr:hypothetical protein CRE_11921 [Caenorhabditis remanei]
MPSSPFPIQLQQPKREGSTTSGSSGGGIRKQRVVLPRQLATSNGNVQYDDGSTIYEGSNNSFLAATGQRYEYN